MLSPPTRRPNRNHAPPAWTGGLGVVVRLATRATTTTPTPSPSPAGCGLARFRQNLKRPNAGRPGFGWEGSKPSARHRYAASKNENALSDEETIERSVLPLQPGRAG